MQPGTIVAYRERGHLALGLVEKVSLPPAKVQLDLIGEDGKKSVLALDRLLFESRLTVPLSLPLPEIKKRLQETRSQIDATAQTIDLKELWELVRELRGRELLQLRGHSDRVFSVAYNCSGSQLASGSWDQTIRVWGPASAGPDVNGRARSR